MLGVRGNSNVLNYQISRLHDICFGHLALLTDIVSNLPQWKEVRGPFLLFIQGVARSCRILGNRYYFESSRSFLEVGTSRHIRC